VICDFPSQLYHLALPFCPPSSWLCKHYTTELSQEVRVVKGLPAEWGECFCTVRLDLTPWAVACWKAVIAVGCYRGSIIILDGITGSRKAVLSGHTIGVTSVTFSSDGKLLVSGGGDKTVKLWDVQTGGVVKTFHGHTKDVFSVSISADCTMIASGSEDKTIHLWDIQMEECLHIMKQQEEVYHVNFSPINFQCLISASGGKVWQWDISSGKINPVHDGSYSTLSLDQIQLVLCQGAVVMIQHFDDGQLFNCHCLIPGGRLIAVAAGSAINIWDITNSNSQLIKTYVGHNKDITSLTFSSPSSLISSSFEESVKFWQIADLLVDSTVTDLKSTPLASTPVKSIALQAKDGIAISSDSNGIVRIWDISTGYCKTTFQAPVQKVGYKDIQLINDRLITVWYESHTINIWDSDKGEFKVLDRASYYAEDIKISGDGSRIYSLHENYIHAWSVLTREGMGKVTLEGYHSQRSLTVDGLRVWVHSPVQKPQGWDFGTPGLYPVKLFTTPPGHLNNTTFWAGKLSRIQGTTTEKVVFRLGGRLTKPADIRWDGQYLVAGYNSGEVLILDFNQVLS